MIEERFAQGNSFFHHMDPRAKLVAAAALAIALAATNTPYPPLAGLLLGLLLCGLAGIINTDLCRRLLAVNAFIIFLWLTIPFSTPGPDVLFSLGFLEATATGVDLALLITLKSNAIVLLLISLAATSSMADIGRALLSLRAPHKLCHLILFTFRYCHVILDEYKRLMTAARIRNFRPRTTIHTYRTYASVAAMLLVRSLERARRVEQAMLLRGYTGTMPSLSVFRLRPVDIAAASALVLVACLLAASPFILPLA